MKKIMLCLLIVIFITACSKKDEECCTCKDHPELDVCCPCDNPYLNKLN